MTRDEKEAAIRAGDGDRQPAARGSGKIFRNAGALLSGKAVAGLLSLAYLAVAARALGPAEMGYLVIASAYALAVSGIARVQSWQAIIRFGTPMVEDGDDRQLRDLFGYTIRLDLISAAVCVVVAFAMVGPAAAVLHWPRQAMPWIYLYCCVTPFLTAATPTGILRLFDRFKILGWQLLSTPIVRFVGALCVWAAGGGLAGFLAVWILSGAFDGLVIWWLGWRELKKRGVAPDLFRRQDFTAPPQWFSYMMKSSVASLFDILRNNAPMLIIGATLGSAASGFLQVAVNLTNLVAHPVNMLSQATLPELTKTAISEGRRPMRDVAYRTMMISMAAASPIVIFYIILREPLVTLVGGAAYAPAAAVLALMACAQVLRISSIVFETASLSLGYAGVALIAQGLSAAIQILSLFYLKDRIGLAAAPVSLMIGFAVMMAAHRLRLHWV